MAWEEENFCLVLRGYRSGYSSDISKKIKQNKRTTFLVVYVCVVIEIVGFKCKQKVLWLIYREHVLCWVGQFILWLDQFCTSFVSVLESSWIGCQQFPTQKKIIWEYPTTSGLDLDILHANLTPLCSGQVSFQLQRFVA